MQNFSNLEEQILAFWEEHQVFEKTLDKPSPKGDFVFYEGPPTANAPPGIHHVLARVFKDAIPRYKTMRGYRVERKAGWDTHGLPVELQIEKKLGMKSKKDIEDYGIAKFNQACRESVWEFKQEWEKLTQRIGFWLDMTDPYITYNTSYIESVWWFLKQAYEADLLKRDYKVVPYCPRCQTPLSSHEVAQGYDEVEDPSVYVKFTLTKKSAAKLGVPLGTAFLVWTTTPWTLPGNGALAVKKGEKYALVRQGEELLIVAAPLQEKIFGNDAVVEQTWESEALDGLRYEPLYPTINLEEYRKAYQIFVEDFVSTEEGTGIVHIAPAYGEIDFTFKRKGIPLTFSVDERGMMKDGLPGAGIFAKEADVAIRDDLKKRSLLFRDEIIRHTYPFCWRCDTPLLYYARASWYITMSKLRSKLIARNKKINWVPAHIQDGRFGEWLREVKDWAITRERYWGTPLPIWQCTECQSLIVIESIDELRQKAGTQIDSILRNDKGELDAHRPFIDAVNWPCGREGCQGVMKRFEEVVDVWLDSGCMSFAQWGYPHTTGSMEVRQNHYPADYISEAIDQTRGWFYTLLAIATVLGWKAPYRNVICLGHILDAKGEKMSKSRGNVVNPWEVIEKHGADALRFYLYSASQAGEPKRFDLKGVEEVTKKVILILLNVSEFWKMHKGENNPAITNIPRLNHILDKWIVSKLQQLIGTVTADLESYELTHATRELADFITDLSTWYLRRSRERFKSAKKSEREAALRTTSYVLATFAKLIAPFMPFLAEHVWKKVTEVAKEPEVANDSSATSATSDTSATSVHLQDWPKFQKRRINTALLEEMKLARKVVELAHAARAEAKIKVRQPLSGIRCQGLGVRLNDELLKLIAEEVNVKAVVAEVAKGTEGANEPKGTKESSDPSVPSGSSGSSGSFVWIAKTDSQLTVALNTQITPELQKEGLARELGRHINEARKIAGLTPSDTVQVLIAIIGSPHPSPLPEGEGRVREVVKEFQKPLRKAALASLIKIVTNPQEIEWSHELELDTHEKLWIGLKRA